MTQKVRDYFKHITTIPRPSGNEEKIRERLIDWASKNSFNYKIDSIGNVVIYLPASPGYEEKDVVILQGHMDMVCVKAPTSTHDFFKDPLQTYEEDGWLKAKDTTLGADNGIALAMMLAIVEHPHPALELFFTVDEERGLTGALNFDTSLLSGKYLINLDTEDEGEICISSSGGARVDCIHQLEFEAIKYPSYELKIVGLQGGHSGVDIHLNRGNAIVALLDIIHSYAGSLQVIEIHGGQADNAIPTDSKAVLAVEDIEKFDKHVLSYIHNYKKKYEAGSLSYSITPHIGDHPAIKNHSDFLSVLLNIPDGVRTMSEGVDGLVESSVNLGMFITADSKFNITYAPRSSDNKKLGGLVDELHTQHGSIGGVVSTRSRYPGRYQNPNDALVQLVKKHYEDVLQSPIKIVAYHAGLECGALVGKLGTHVQSVSFGPTIKHPHSINEKVYIPSVDRVYQVLKKILINF
ncbi:MAG: beta-Ala-His dipeptidase [candidate division SR1 bacterium]|nr:beta-Ala-His dipeptidase [candidate division SR1 bacterium]